MLALSSLGQSTAIRPAQARDRSIGRQATVQCRAAGSATAVKDTTELGKSGVKVSSLGIGAWSWGDRSGYWGWNKEYGAPENKSAYQGLLEHGVNLIDTSEVYGFGKSEELIADFQQGPEEAFIATKFAPLPWRFFKSNVERALQGMAEEQRAGRAQAVGVSNFNAQRLRRSWQIMQDKGVPLASNQVQYSLLYREPERNGVLAACQELGITLIAYSPMCQGLLSGKYTETNKPTGQRKALLNDDRIRGVVPLVSLMRDVGSAHGGKSPAQVANNWCICKGTLPIPGAKNRQQAEELAGSLGWRLTADQVKALDKASDECSTSASGAPFEKW